MNNFNTITQELNEVTGGSYWSRMHYARAAWASGYGFPFGYGPMAPRSYYPGPVSPRAMWREYAYTRGLWG